MLGSKYPIPYLSCSESVVEEPSRSWGALLPTLIAQTLQLAHFGGAQEVYF